MRVWWAVWGGRNGPRTGKTEFKETYGLFPYKGPLTLKCGNWKRLVGDESGLLQRNLERVHFVKTAD
ncbi:MAG: hypothetical protein Ct9H300mP27_08210 [Chloroflexota bacterium]|nr:MAG: hypothetical protein Ct9H300mP27_08210 [Chloroflexota bacterium]